MALIERHIPTLAPLTLLGRAEAASTVAELELTGLRLDDWATVDFSFRGECALASNVGLDLRPNGSASDLKGYLSSNYGTPVARTDWFVGLLASTATPEFCTIDGRIHSQSGQLVGPSIKSDSQTAHGNASGAQYNLSAVWVPSPREEITSLKIVAASTAIASGSIFELWGVVAA